MSTAPLRSLNCGHVLCRTPCLRAATGICPQCSVTIPLVPNPCRLLQRIAYDRSPAEFDRRTAALASLPSAALPESIAGGSGSVGGGGGEETERLSAVPSGGSRGVPPSPVLDQVRRSSEDSEEEEEEEDEEEAVSPGAREDERFPWYGVGCDRCGCLPILGRRYRCMDCPDSIGFDLCGACHDARAEVIQGRFNQFHTERHRMEKVRVVTRESGTGIDFVHDVELFPPFWTPVQFLLCMHF